MKHQKGKNVSCSKLIRLESWGSKFVFRDTRNYLPPVPEYQGRHPVGLFINYTDNT